MSICLITGSGGLIGSAAVRFFSDKFDTIVGVDNNFRKYFFGEAGDVTWNIQRLCKEFKKYIHHHADLCDKNFVDALFRNYKFSAIIHCAAQPSHDWAAKEPITDFDINARATLLLLEATRNHCIEAPFVFTSTNKVYGDTPNTLPLIELPSRWELPHIHKWYNGIDETMTIDDSIHSVFGASKLAADIMVQEYGRYFNMNTVSFRGGCLTGIDHSSAELHGFLAYLVKCIVNGLQYTVFGHKGKQVRDNINSFDVCTAIHEYIKAPTSGHAYNLGGCRFANISMYEAIKTIEELAKIRANVVYSENARIGDHIWWISSMEKFKSHYPKWQHTYTIDKTLEEMVDVAKSQK